MSWKSIADKGFGHVPITVIKERCIYLHTLDPSKRCEFVKNSFCDDNSELFMYHFILFCGIDNPSFNNLFVILYILAMLVWIVFLFFILAITVDGYFCPALGQLSKMMHLSENLSGVTLLALGNGLPDILTAITSATKGDTILMFNQILGGGMFVSCVVAGSIAISRPFYLQPYHFLRDLFFTLGSIVWIEATTNDEEVTLWEACSYIGIYIFYLIIVIGGFLIQEKLNKYVHIDKKNDVEWTELRGKRTIMDADDQLAQFLKSREDQDFDENMKPASCKTLFKDFWISVNPIDKQKWKEIEGYEKISTIVKAPFIFFLNLLIPVISPDLKRNGWSKLLNCLHCLIFPSFVLFGCKAHDIILFGFPIFLYISPIGLVLAIMVFCTSKQNTPPAYHKIFAIIGFIMGILIIFTTVKEVVGVLSLFGTLCQVSPQTLGLTVLAWGNSLGDAVANIQVAKQGFQRMAFAACFAGILANTLLSMGLAFLIKNIKTPENIDARGGVMGPNCSTFFIMNLCFSILYVLLTKFQARKSYGIFLILIYVEFMVFNILCELEIIHPLGVDHEFAVDIFKPEL